MSRQNEIRKAASLVEVVVSTLLVGVVLTAALETVGGSSRTYRAAGSQVDAATLADALFAEIAALPYREPNSTSETLGLESGESRSPNRLTLDDVDDYAGLTESPPVDRSGATVTGYDGWQRSTTVSYVNRSRDSGGSLTDRSTDQGLKRVAVTVTDADGEVSLFTALRSAKGPVEVAPTVTATMVRRLQAEVETGATSCRTVGVTCANESRAP